MSDKLPQPTHVLIHRLRRVAKACDAIAEAMSGQHVQDGEPAKWRARANTCWQSAARLAEISGFEVDAARSDEASVVDGF